MNVMKKDWFALGLILLLAGLILLAYSNTVADQNDYVLRDSVDNNLNYNKGFPTVVSVSAYFNAYQHFYFNFTKGRYWGLVYDQLEPANTFFAPNASIEPWKALSFYVYTPSGDVVSSLVYLVSGTQPFAVVYFNQSRDFVPLTGGNLSLGKARMEGNTTRAGNFTFVATSIDPYVEHLNSTDLYDVVAHGFIRADPPLQMHLYGIDAVTTKPYFSLFLFAGASLIIVGVLPFVWATRPKKKHSHKRLGKANS